MVYDPYSDTRPSRPQPPSSAYSAVEPTISRRRKRRYGSGCCIGPFIGALILVFTVAVLVYLLAPARVNVLILGIDYTPPGSSVGRSDTIVLMTVIPGEPYIGVLSIPRDLWVDIPGVGENRINTAHFFAEAGQSGSGPQAIRQTIEQNFGVKADYFVRIRFEAVRRIVDAMGGVDIFLDKPLPGFPAGRYHLTGNKALAFARHRIGGDDFFRMEQGQLLIKSILMQLLKPYMWPKIPMIIRAGFQQFDTDIPWWQFPRLAVALLRAGPDGMDSRIITREMVTPYTTAEGASVLLPDWSKINPVVREMFGE